MSKNIKVVTDVGMADVKIVPMPFELKYKGQPLETKSNRPVVKYKTADGVEAVTVSINKQTGDVVPNGTVGRMYQREDTAELVEKNQLIPYLVTQDNKEIPTEPNSKTDTWELTYEPLAKYIDSYQMEKYYYLEPSEGDSKKDFQRELAKRANATQLKKIWDKLDSEELVGRGRLHLTSAGYVPQYGFLRAVTVGNKWALEVGIFKQVKKYGWTEDKNMKPVSQQQAPRPVTNQAEIDEI